MKYKRIPFDLELAKAITKGEKEGRVVTRDGRKARVICWDKAGKLFPIVALLADTQFNENTVYYTEKGKRTYPETIDCDDDLILEVPDKQEFKEGDVVTFNFGGAARIAIIKRFTECKLFYSYVELVLCTKYLAFDGNSLFEDIRLATEEERQTLIDALKKDNSDKSRVYLKRFFGIKVNQKFKPFDKVLVKDFSNKNCHQDVWKIGHFEYFDEKDNTYHVEGIYGGYNYCIPYNEQTKHLLRTTDDWEG